MNRLRPDIKAAALPSQTGAQLPAKLRHIFRNYQMLIVTE